ncbi:hypothetical protein [Parafrankia discariae]|uniref:hypothetical protein n=1 Tax=Parafrankia discariae TaxID=365528 RepID=UPI00036BE33D|nr:hypothetical protein [Parafrankia discariae]
MTNSRKTRIKGECPTCQRLVGLMSRSPTFGRGRADHSRGNRVSRHSTTAGDTTCPGSGQPTTRIQDTATGQSLDDIPTGNISGTNGIIAGSKLAARAAAGGDRA